MQSKDPTSAAARLRMLLRESGMSQAEFSRKAHLDPGNLSRILSGQQSLGTALAARVAEALGVSRAWLVNGQGPIHDPKEPAGAPVYDIDITAGATELTRAFTDDRVIGRVSLPELSPECPVVRVSGNSMAPTINNGALVSIRRVDPSGNIFWGQIYVVVLDDYRMVKYVRRHDNPEMVTLHSANPSYEDMEVRRSDIRGLFLVEAVINFDRRC